MQAFRKLEESLAENYGWGTRAELREKILAAVIKKAERLGVAPHDYCRIAASSQSELLAMVEETASSNSCFFREIDEFQYVKKHILPEIISRRIAEADLKGKPPEDVRIWSACCSTGEEAYSLGIVFDTTVSEMQANATDLPAIIDADIFATDVRNSALLAASRARYDASLLSNVSDEIKARYFKRIDLTNALNDSEVYEVAPIIRRLTAFRRVNLLERLFWNGVYRKFDLIVCTKQLSFLNNTAVRQMVSNLTSSLREDGYLMVSPQEAYLVNSSRLVQLPDNQAFFQRKDLEAK